MSDTKHTPGPWTLRPVWVKDEEGWEVVAEYEKGEDYENYMELARISKQGVNTHGNARLISLAPEMRDELIASIRLFVDALDNMPFLWRKDGNITPEGQAWREKLKKQVTQARTLLTKLDGKGE